MTSESVKHGDTVVTLVSMNVNGTASHSTMDVKLGWSSHALQASGVPADALVGTGKQLFNDRVANGAQPFDVAKPDDIQLQVTNEPLVTFTLLTWNKGKISFTPTCDGGLLHGWSAPGQTYYILQFTKKEPIR